MLERELGEILSISIGTAVPLERLLTKETSKGYGYLYLNIHTLFRNFYGSFKNNSIPSSYELIKLFVEEITVIQGIVTEALPGHIQPVFYITAGKSIYKCFPRAKIKVPNTPKQVNYETTERTIIQKTLTKLKNIEVTIFDILIKGKNGSALIITHQPLDLLSYHSFRKLTLLESHTGAFKTRSEWITKLSKNEHYRNIPFNALSIQILGDRSVQFEGLGRKITSALVEVASSCNWNSMTTLEKVKFDIRNKVLDKPLKEAMLEMASVNLNASTLISGIF